ncbi:MAG: GNAT family N-acetyltransferase [Paracoccaceae bacterium]
MILRKVVVDDAPFIWQCRQELEGSVALASGQAQDYAAHLAWIERALADPQRIFMIPEDNGRAVGYVRFDPAAGVTGWQTSLCVASGARGKGVGGRALTMACALAKERGFVPVFADVHEENLASRAVFISAGFGSPCPVPGKPGYARYWLFRDLEDDTHA